MATLLPFRDINVHVSGSHYSFLSPSSPNSPTLVVDRPSGDLRLHDGKLAGARRISSIAGILGIIRLRLDKYIVVISKAQPVGRIRGHMIYKVQETELLPLRERPLHDHDEDTYVALLKSMLKTGPMYFSYSIDLTNSFQRQAQADPSAPLWQRADDRFFWNRFIQSDLIDLRSGLATTAGYRHSHGPQPGADPYILPVMFGMLEIRPTTINNTPLTYILITRRSRHRAGTRYFSRGIDDHGNVSNFNETEQTIVLNDNGNGGFGGRVGSNNKDMQVLSYVQTRGSVPVYWAEINTLKYTPKLQVRAVETSVTSAKLHFDEQISTYGDNYLVNLVNQKGREKRVKEAYEQLVKILVSNASEGVESDKITNEKLHVIEPNKAKQRYDRLHYIYFDFHNETKGLRWHRAQLLLQQLEQSLLANGYFRGVDYPGDASGRMEIRNRQTGVVRTNCMDCLDRTNVVQSMIGRYMLTRQLIDLGVLREGDMVSNDAQFELLFRNVWADNADIVSRAYSGTGALKTDFTRTGNRTKAGMAQDFSNSCTRYVKNNFLDGPRQDAYDLFLGTYLPASGGAGTLMFVDRRPLLIQAMPYFLAASVFFILVGSFARRDASTAVWPFRLIMFIFLAIGGVTMHFIWTHGTLFVNWPKLNTPPYAVEGYQEALDRVRSNPILGGTVARHERGKSLARIGFMEEGKKRIE